MWCLVCGWGVGLWGLVMVVVCGCGDCVGCFCVVVFGLVVWVYFGVVWVFGMGCGVVLVFGLEGLWVFVSVLGGVVVLCGVFWVLGGFGGWGWGGCYGWVFCGVGLLFGGCWVGWVVMGVWGILVSGVVMCSCCLGEFGGVGGV